MWYISFFHLFEYRIRFTNTSVVEKFSYLVSLWECSRTSNKILGISVDSTAERALEGHVSELAAYQWDDEEHAFAEVDVLTSTFALFNGSA